MSFSFFYLLLTSTLFLNISSSMTHLGRTSNFSGFYNSNDEDFYDITPIYYDMDGKPVPQLSDKVEVVPTLKNGALRYGWLPCSCQNLLCSCCSNINITQLNFKRKSCINFTYDPNEFALNTDVLMNEKPVFHYSISGKNPPPVCLPVSPAPFVPGLDFCIRFYNVYTPGRNIHACMNFETQILRVPLLVLQFDCFRMGEDGFAVVKPNVVNAGLPTTSVKPQVENSNIETSTTEFYDEVVEEEKSKNRHNVSVIGM